MFASTKASRVSSASGYQISRSLRFNSGDSARLSRSLSGDSGNPKFVFSAWVKRSAIGLKAIASSMPSTTNFAYLTFTATDTLRLVSSRSTTIIDVATTAVFRDTTAWYHIAVFVDTEQATATDRVIIYVNGIRQAVTFTTTPALSAGTTRLWRAGNAALGARVSATTPTFTDYFDGYITDVVSFPNPSLVTLADFGRTDTTTGQWVPVNPQTIINLEANNNDIYLKLTDNSDATSGTLGKDSSANNLDFTPVNISVTAGINNDSVIDVPNQYDDGGNGRGNYCVLNPIDLTTTATLANGNLAFTSATTGHNAIGSMGMTTGKWYWEAQTSAGTTQARATVYGTSAASYYSFAANTTWYGFRFDADAGTLDVTTNGTSWTSVATGLTSGPYFPFFNNNGTTTKVISINFGQQGFNYTPPTGYKALNTFNLPTPSIVKPSDYFNTVLYTGTGSSRSVTGLDFTPDFTWIKGRSGATDHLIYDSVRGVQNQLITNSTLDASTQSTGLTAFNSDGFTVGSLAAANTNAATYASFNFKEGSIPGFDIVTYTGNGANRTIGHALGVAPNLMITKARTTAGTDTGWVVYHRSLPTSTTAYLELHSNLVVASSATIWNSTNPTSSVFSLGNNSFVNNNGDTYVAYLWSEVPGFSRIGSFVGNANVNGPFVWCGFRPAFLIFKLATGVNSNWNILNTKTGTINPLGPQVQPSGATAEGTSTWLDFTSTGFKVRTTTAALNNSGSTIVFAAFAEFPFKYANAR